MKDDRKRLEVFYNLHKKIWSVRYRGVVLEHSRYVELDGVSFDVQPAGNARVRREKRKSVHAFVRGKQIMNRRKCLSRPNLIDLPSNWKEVTYNPYKHKTFVFKDTGKPVKKAEKVMMDAGNMFQKGGSLRPSVWAYKGE